MRVTGVVAGKIRLMFASADPLDGIVPIWMGIAEAGLTVTGPGPPVTVTLTPVTLAFVAGPDPLLERRTVQMRSLGALPGTLLTIADVSTGVLPSCVTVKVALPAVIVAERGCAPGLATAEYPIRPLPVP